MRELNYLDFLMQKSYFRLYNILTVMDFVIHDLAVCKKNFVNIVTFRKSKMLLEPKVTVFGFLNIHPFSPRGFFTFFVAVAHGEPHLCRTPHAARHAPHL